MTVRILVTVGTHEQPFQRLLRMVEHGVNLPDTEWVVQYGAGTFASGRAVEARSYFSHEEIAKWNAWADLVISHASPGAVFDALRAGAQPLVVPRRRFRGEHVNDHQVEFAKRLVELGLARTADREAEMLQEVLAIECETDLDRSGRIASIYEDSQRRQADFVAAFMEALEMFRAD